jgi:VanZ family protein
MATASNATGSRAVTGLKPWRILLAIAMLVILVLSLMPPSSDLPTTGWDKSNHMLGFALLGLLGVRGWPVRAVPALVLLLAYGGLIEILQWLTPYRSAEWADLGADGVGLVLGLVLARLSHKFAEGRKKG